jgi:hypothetical protein
MKLSTPPKLRRGLPLDPLLPWIRRALVAAISTDLDEDQGIKALGRRYALRFGGAPGSAERQLQRMLNGTHRTISEEKADLWCQFLDIHLDVVWPEEVAA